MNSVGDRIRAARLARGLTQGELARGLATKGFISQIELNRALPSLPKLRLIADRLGLSLSELAGTTGPRELTLLRKSAELAVKAGEPERALELVVEALPMARHASERAELFRVRGLALDAMGRWPEALAAYQAAAAAAPVDDPDLLAAIYVEIGTVLGVQEQFNGAVEASLRGLTFLDRSKHPDSSLRSRALTNLSANCYALGQPARALEYAEAALAAATDAESLLRMAKAHHALSAIARQAGDIDKAIEHCDRALETYRRVRDERAANQILNNLGDAQYAAGRHKQAHDLQLRCLERARALKDDYGAGCAGAELARYALDAGRHEQAITIAKEAERAAAAAGDHLHQAMSLAYQGLALSALSRPRASDQRFRAACRMLREREALGKLSEVCVMYADALRRRQQVDRAFALMRMALQRDFGKLDELIGSASTR